LDTYPDPQHCQKQKISVPQKWKISWFEVHGVLSRDFGFSCSPSVSKGLLFLREKNCQQIKLACLLILLSCRSSSPKKLSSRDGGTRFSWRHSKCAPRQSPTNAPTMQPRNRSASAKSPIFERHTRISVCAVVYLDIFFCKKQPKADER
jgi:hypothetical protein